MSPQDVKTFETMLADYTDADYQARRANARKAKAHVDIVDWVARRVPAGTDVLDVPAFLRRSDD